MKKYKFILCFIISIYIFSITAFAQTEDISANVKIDQFSVTISGNAKMSKYASLVVGTEEEIIYLDQADCDDNGNYVFTFNFDKEMPAGEYPFKISSDAVDGTYEGVINYLGNVTYKEEACAISDIKLEIVDFIPKIQGTISCIEGATIKYTFTDVTENVVIDEKIITAEDGEYFISYELANLINTKKYNVKLTCNNDFHDLVLINANVNYSLNILTISYDMTFFNDSSMYATLRCRNIDHVDMNYTISEYDTASLTLPIIYSQASFATTAKLFADMPIYPLDGIEESKNPELYSALKHTKNLDPDNDGNITIEELANLTGTLDLSNRKIKNLGGIQYCTNITGLVLDNNQITDLRYLSTLKNIKILRMKNNNITSLAPIKKWDKLVHVDLSYNDIVNITPLSNNKRLKYLDLTGNEIKDASALPDVNYYALYLKRNYIKQSVINSFNAMHK